MASQPAYVRISHPGLGQITVQESQVNGLLKVGWSRVEGDVAPTDALRPDDGAKKAAWVDYAETRGGDRTLLDKMKQADIVAAFGN